jgi:hypothetical protein
MAKSPAGFRLSLPEIGRSKKYGSRLIGLERTQSFSLLAVAQFRSEFRLQAGREPRKRGTPNSIKFKLSRSLLFAFFVFFRGYGFNSPSRGGTITRSCSRRMENVAGK